MHTRIHTYTQYTHAHMHAHTQYTHPHARTHTQYTHACTHSVYMHTRAHACTQYTLTQYTHMHAHMHSAHTRMHAYSVHTCMHAHTHSVHTHTHTLQATGLISTSLRKEAQQTGMASPAARTPQEPVSSVRASTLGSRGPKRPAHPPLVPASSAPPLLPVGAGPAHLVHQRQGGAGAARAPLGSFKKYTCQWHWDWKGWDRAATAATGETWAHVHGSLRESAKPPLTPPGSAHRSHPCPAPALPLSQAGLSGKTSSSSDPFPCSQEVVPEPHYREGEGG